MFTAIVSIKTSDFDFEIFYEYFNGNFINQTVFMPPGSLAESCIGGTERATNSFSGFKAFGERSNLNHFYFYGTVVGKYTFTGFCAAFH